MARLSPVSWRELVQRLRQLGDEMGLNLRDLYEALEQRGLPTSNVSQ